MLDVKSVIEFLTTRDWTGYPFVPPLTALCLGLLLIPLYEEVLDVKLRSFFERIKEQNEAKDPEETVVFLLDYPKISQLLQTRTLQVAYLSEIPAFLVSVITTLQSTRPWLLTTLVVLTIGLYAAVVPKLFMRNEPDYVRTEVPRWAKRSFTFTYLTLYARVLGVLNIVLIAIIIASLPKK